ncbi:hypothetical protein Pyn_28507 [Prunus yedoensis var. nudiflora]|uniref:Secreted protein n=1 Tax=Prunus yedoensis var. nudiflora TaxID=2094558 RepID=A0A314XW90_PRUYE|nr:hypothetical protein Pyn_28507 [Prunus yedoensis var. nudiflora]
MILALLICLLFALSNGYGGTKVGGRCKDRRCEDEKGGSGVGEVFDGARQPEPAKEPPKQHRRRDSVPGGGGGA